MQVAFLTAQPIIQLRNVSKRFELASERPTTVLESLIALFARRGRRERPRELWAVHELSVDIAPGQCIGFIGRNGSGKSTALKLIAGILRPTEGEIVVNGRISALLELGAGFHADLTGRENIYLNGAILGLNKQQIDSAYDDIVAFSELEEFIDMPVKHYSSGMYMRLGFSVAVHVDPDVLIVDEILAVGDQAFQNKCLEQIYRFKREGKTIIIVSHNLGTLRNLCSHLVWMEHGRLRAAGLTDEIINEYLAYTQGVENDRLKARPTETQQGYRRWGTGEVALTAVRFVDDAGLEQQVFTLGEPLTVEMHYTAERPIIEPEFGLAFFYQDGTHIAGPNNRAGGAKVEIIEGSGVVKCRIPRLPLLPGMYMVTAAVHDTILNQRAFDFHEKAFTFRVTSNRAEPPHGLVELPTTWEFAQATLNMADDKSQTPAREGSLPLRH